MKKNLIIQIASTFFVLLFLYTGLMKIVERDTFIQALFHSPILQRYAYTVAFGVPAVELLTVICLLVPRLQRIGLYASFVLMFSFTLYVAYMLFFRRSELPCSCGGIIRLMNWHQHLYFNTAATILAFWAIWLDRKRRMVQAATFHNTPYA